MPQFSTYCTAPKGTLAPHSRLAGFNMQGKRLYTVVPEFTKRKRTDAATDRMSKPVNLGTLPYKNGALINRPSLTNCILPRTAMGGYCNGVAKGGEDVCKGGDCKSPPCTEGTSSGEDSSVTVLSDEARLVCPEVAVHFSGTLLSSRVGLLSACQSELEARLVRLQKRLREKQLLLVQGHAHSQLAGSVPRPRGHTQVLPGTAGTPLMTGRGPLPYVGDGEAGGCAQLHHRLRQAVKLVDAEATDVSSDEAGEEGEGEEPNER